MAPPGTSCLTIGKSGKIVKTINIIRYIELKKLLKKLANMLRYDTIPILEIYPQLVEYIEKQSSFVSQVTLYGYIKTRAGTQWPKLFENEEYLTSLKIARWHIFAACVADLSLFAAAQFHKSGEADAKICAKLAYKITASILSDINQEDIEETVFLAVIKNSQKRYEETDYAEVATGDSAFQTSAQALLDWAPVIDDFKKNDALIVRNSLHLRWIGVRRDLAKGLQTKPILAEFNAHSA